MFGAAADAETGLTVTGSEGDTDDDGDDDDDDDGGDGRGAAAGGAGGNEEPPPAIVLRRFFAAFSAAAVVIPALPTSATAGCHAEPAPLAGPFPFPFPFGRSSALPSFCDTLSDGAFFFPCFLRSLVPVARPFFSELVPDLSWRFLGGRNGECVVCGGRQSVCRG